MAAIDVHNESPGWLVLWLEPLGSDYWLRPGERCRVRTDYLGDEPAFAVIYWVGDDDRAAGIENINVIVEQGDCFAEVTDPEGNVVECGRQRPDEIDRKWRGLAET
ncbi:hypothetical protein LWC34_24025 [Kibdelosporangium philippinense]|uniref:Uncharacterized protein n=1 Tax=Kibdelosporangium philippinense TaxID=211113 RepID=A0ABS8ZDE5_9PSEU|nr:hypothetical protein [Kibdelosporangium philippinense]MCE7005873.1 hypothetical protein [Kibdelosporangium philippinense]